MKFEIEIISNDANTEIFDLKDFLLQNDMQPFKLQSKEYMPMEGEMSIAFTVAAIVGEKVLDIALEKCFGIVLENKIKAWLKKRNIATNSKIEVVTTISSGIEKLYYITNANGKTKLIDQGFTLIAQNTTAVIIGNGEFESSFSKIAPINGNVEQIYKILSDKRIFNIPRENIKILLNKNNTEIEENLLRESKKDNLETFIVYFAGHGYRANLNKLYLISKNSKKIGDHIIGGLDFDFIKDVVIKGSTANNKIIMIDACHSGIAAQSEDENELVNSINVKGSYILTSSSADQVSYFNSSHDTTYFTHELVSIFKNGLSNDKEWLSIDDVYESLKNNLAAKKLPLPRSKSELSIPTSNFLLANNVQFDIQAIFTQAKGILKNGRIEEALEIFNKLHIRYSDNYEIKTELDKCRNELLFNKYVESGDTFYFINNDYFAALQAYKSATLIKKEYNIVLKIEKCEKLISEITVVEKKAENVNQKSKPQVEVPPIRDSETNYSDFKNQNRINKNSTDLNSSGPILQALNRKYIVILILFVCYYFNEQYQKEKLQRYYQNEHWEKEKAQQYYQEEHQQKEELQRRIRRYKY
jgi:hypothetical protein